MTDKQKNFMLSHGLFSRLNDLGLNPDSLSTSQASGIISKFYEDQKHKEEPKQPEFYDWLLR